MLAYSAIKSKKTLGLGNNPNEILSQELHKPKRVNFERRRVISNHIDHHYDQETYVNRCMQIQIIPMLKFFDINDLVLFHKIIYERVPLSLPNFIHRYSGSGITPTSGKLRFSFVCKPCKF